MSTSPVPLVELGKNGPKVPHLGFGLMGLSYESYGTVPNDEERFKILDRAHELGSTFWDSAEYDSSSSLTMIDGGLIVF
jgi:aryl-alcohol dehydrogenase-like predicted oxidoreductase